MQRPWTNPTEIVAYIAAHLLGVGWSFLVTPVLSRMLISEAPGVRPFMTAIFLGHSLIVITVVFGIFIVIRGLIQSNSPQR